MSEYLFPVAITATFLSVGIMIFGLQHSIARRRRAMEVLQTQLGQTTIPVGREDDLARPFRERALIPVLGTLGALGTRLTPIGMRKRISRKLVLAGNPPGWTADKIAAIKVLAAGTGAAVGWLAAVALERGPLGLVGGAVVLGGIGALAPGATLDIKAKGRQEGIRRALPDTMDLLTISVEAGLGFDAALHQVVKSTEGPLAQEIARMLQEMQVGVSRVDALRSLASRTDVEELTGFTLAIIQAEQFGVSVSKVLRSQASVLRTKRRQRAEEKAMKVPVKILFPLIFCILPAMFIVLMGPAVIKIGQFFFGVF
jgi:tight adherence protein C